MGRYALIATSSVCWTEASSTLLVDLLAEDNGTTPAVSIGVIGVGGIGGLIGVVPVAVLFCSDSISIVVSVDMPTIG